LEKCQSILVSFVFSCALNVELASSFSLAPCSGEGGSVCSGEGGFVPSSVSDSDKSSSAGAACSEGASVSLSEATLVVLSRGSTKSFPLQLSAPSSNGEYEGDNAMEVELLSKQKVCFENPSKSYERLMTCNEIDGKYLVKKAHVSSCILFSHECRLLCWPKQESQKYNDS